ncbi:anthranilate synthase component I [Gulosibacter molinativorax]|uniref:Anthranilate synthase n=1 Tax=Gulosibacter molinativorax TaxID=256821 RepID=A0ABT7C5N1_9MICO|nr:anthranilate synthase component I [Gulosibacter molinativorax]MDJ1369991.1 anthranilate synthase component I [Gulosibacter molinativorax]QUY63819.1 Anthranilate synthase component 1 [Gulosibacter molinativorax]
MLTVVASDRVAEPSEIDDIIAGLDDRAGVVLASGVEYPGRYTRWDMGFIDPPLVIEGRGFTVQLRALNDRGLVPLRAFTDILSGVEGFALEVAERETTITITPQRDDILPEEERTRRRSSFAVLRHLLAALPKDAQHLGLYGSLGYDLVRQIEQLDEPAGGDQRDLVMYLPDSIIAVDRQRDDARRYEFEFSYEGQHTAGIPRTATKAPFVGPAADATASRDHERGEYAALVQDAKQYFERGDLFEVVPGQAFREPVSTSPSAIFRSLVKNNPAPYGAIMNLGENEFLVTASPEMFVRVQGDRVETAPISGTIARGADAIEDSDQIKTLINSDKDKSELTMCTDVDRNDKSRVCEPGSVRIIGRRQIELYSKVIHTVDHVEGTLREDFDGLDAFATHMWAVTVTGAPKIWAMRFIDEHERSPRTWYAGALGVLYANGDVNTGLTIRAAMIREGIAEVRAGGTLLIDSVPEDEERETEMKASALLEAIQSDPSAEAAEEPEPAAKRGAGHRILFFDHEDSFVQMLAGYMRETGAEVRTVRVPKGGVPVERIREQLDALDPTLVVMSPGPGSPSDFRDSDILAELDARGLPVFGVCLGQQAIGEYLGASLGQLGYPLHGQEREVEVIEPGFLDEMPKRFVTGRYHSLYVEPATVSGGLKIIASDDDGIPMAVEHTEKRWFAVQFHPESLMTLRDRAGHRIIDAVMERIS